tara:strand:+ start:289 stop:414 length:126 start_codon:yes stop_codon:yes gene_type:complete
MAYGRRMVTGSLGKAISGAMQKKKEKKKKKAKTMTAKRGKK